MKKLITALAMFGACAACYAQVPPIRGEYSAGVYKNIQVDVNGNLLTAPAAASTSAVTQSGTWTVQPGNTANTTAWKVDGSAVTQPVSGTITAAVSTGTVTDRSGTITLGGTAQTIMAANSSRKYLLIQNTSDTTMWCNFTTTAVATQPSFNLIPGATFTMEGSFVSTELISCIGATTAKIFTAKEG